MYSGEWIIIRFYTFADGAAFDIKIIDACNAERFNVAWYRGLLTSFNDTVLSFIRTFENIGIGEFSEHWLFGLKDSIV